MNMFDQFSASTQVWPRPAPEANSPLMLKPTNEPDGLANSNNSWTPKSPASCCNADSFLDRAACTRLAAAAPSYPQKAKQEAAWRAKHDKTPLR